MGRCVPLWEDVWDGVSHCGKMCGTVCPIVGRCVGRYNYITFSLLSSSHDEAVDATLNLNSLVASILVYANNSFFIIQKGFY